MQKSNSVETFAVMILKIKYFIAVPQPQQKNFATP